MTAKINAVLSDRNPENKALFVARSSKSFGATMIEYAVLIGLIGIIALAAVQLMGQKISSQLSILATSV